MGSSTTPSTWRTSDGLMAEKLLNVVTWKGRTTPGHRIIPRHLKLAIMSRGRISLASRNILWLLDLARNQGETWPDRLDKPFEDIVDQVAVTVELFWQQPRAMLEDDVNTTIAAYLGLRHRRHLPGCWYLLYGWVRHSSKSVIESNLDLDLTRLYTKPRVFPRGKDKDRYIVLVYACIPTSVLRHIRPEQQAPQPPPAMPTGMPPLEGLTARNVMRHVRVDASTSAESLGEIAGDVQWVEVLGKRSADNHLWFKIRILTTLSVRKSGKDIELAAGTQAWVAEGGLDLVAAPWSVFRAHLAAWESEYAQLSLRDRITTLRRLTHSKDFPFDSVIGASNGTAFEEDRPPDDTQWQIAKDYKAFRAPDGRLVDIHHLLVGIDALQRSESYPVVSTVPVGSSWAAATWGGDIGSAVADMHLRTDTNWESRNPRASNSDRVEHYYYSRAADWDLLADIDAWQLDVIRRSGQYDTIDFVAASYYEKVIDGQLRALTSDRGLAIGRFLRHYGFQYDVEVDYANYPVLTGQKDGVKRVLYELSTFARIWILQRNPYLVAINDPDAKTPDSGVVSEMAALFLTWLEHLAIENGVVP